MPNQLAETNSPYLLQHKDNPVDWYPWGPEALQKAQEEEKPIFLSIGYAACHWCHVMAHESFEDPQIAALLNEHFVNIKVDREERPDLDHIYMQAVVALTGHGGWPMSVFLTPSGEPFYGGTYFPPEPRHNMPSFRQVITALADTWQEKRADVLNSSAQIAQQLQAHAARQSSAAEAPLSKSTLTEGVESLFTGYDWQYGGWGQAPKFPQGMAIDFLLTQAARGNRDAKDTALHALDSMALGGMYDLVGGGFARYSVDNLWLVPHFEKMLYDNALLARAYLHAYLLTGDATYRRVCEKTLNFVLREMTHPEGGFYASLDADSDGEEGKFYLWTLEQIQDVLSDPEETQFFVDAHGITKEGNFEGKTVLQRAVSDQELASKYDLTAPEVPRRLEPLYAKLLEARAERVRPGTDDKILTAWNGLMMVVFAEAGRYLERPDYTRAAVRNADFLIENLWGEDQQLHRAWRQGSARHRAYLEDHAALILGLIALYQSQSDQVYFQKAAGFMEEMLAHYQDPAGGFFDTRDDQTDLLYRPKDLQDNATPSGNALAATALLTMSAYTNRRDWQNLAQDMLGAQEDQLTRYPVGFGQWLLAADLAVGPLREVALLGSPDDPRTEQLQGVLWEAYRPRTMVAQSAFPPPPEAPPLLNNRPLLEEKPTVYVCENFTCQLPVQQPEALRDQLKETS
jgi:hypothetical protein